MKPQRNLIAWLTINHFHDIHSFLKSWGHRRLTAFRASKRFEMLSENENQNLVDVAALPLLLGQAVRMQEIDITKPKKCALQATKFCSHSAIDFCRVSSAIAAQYVHLKKRYSRHAAT